MNRSRLVGHVAAQTSRPRGNPERAAASLFSAVADGLANGVRCRYRRFHGADVQAWRQAPRGRQPAP